MGAARIGIIGCGVIGSQHIKAASESDSVDLVAVADLIEERRNEAAGMYDVPKKYVDGVDMISDGEVEGVVLAMPAISRVDLALKAFEKGINVLTEKPVARNADEVRTLIEARGDLIAGCCSSRYRFLPSTNAVTDFYASGALGDLRVIHCRALRAGGPPPAKEPPIWRIRRDLNGGGIMSNWGCYDLDYLLGITGWTIKPRVVLGQMWGVPPKFHALADPSSDAETHLAATIQCDDGIAIHYERGEMMTCSPRLSWQLVGSEGSLDLEMVSAEKEIAFHKAVSETGVESETLWEGNEDTSVVHQGPVSDFAQAIREGRQPKTSLEQALVIQQITDAIYASAETGKAAEIE
jgi:predicted dehydrogenase